MTPIAKVFVTKDHDGIQYRIRVDRINSYAIGLGPMTKTWKLWCRMFGDNTEMEITYDTEDDARRAVKGLDTIFTLVNEEGEQIDFVA